MKLTKFLHDQGYDLIDGPVRNHKPLQLWLKRNFKPAELYYANVSYAFKSGIALEEIENPALNVDSSKKEDYSFNIGITLLEEILESLNLGFMELSAKIKSGKTVTISYENSVTKEYAIGNIESYLSSADFIHPNPPLLKNANNNNILILTGIVFAKNLVVSIETDFSVDAALIASLNGVADGKLDFSMNSKNKLKMVSSGNSFFPIAVKTSRINFIKGVFKKLNLVSGNQF
ncbi:hypothetical protein P0M11_10330 [Kaistella sp. PBT33-4]|uniref:gasdermin n=1 Tax=Kaistella sp. PBT33-4 TaxID=3032000 RepID=UPI0023D838CF|nr:hypothetical protein [Kaistella sp. PBT33-4]MDF0720392.1 hypothetical protein [Kaistella sp. PBT33-4]